MQPHEPFEPKADQESPETRTPTGAETGAPKESNAQQGPYLTTATGVRVADTDHSLKAGERGPTLLQDHHLREKVLHFDHERIPERVVHARGAGAHGTFVGYGSAAEVCRQVSSPKGSRRPCSCDSRPSSAPAGPQTPSATRAASPRSSTRGGELRPGRQQHPGVLHPGRHQVPRHHPRGQAASRSGDPASPERARHLLGLRLTPHRGPAPHIWNMSDRGVPRSYRTMEGFGVHTFRLTNAADETALAKFHWKPAQGVHSLT